MAGICLPNPTSSFRKTVGVRCCSGARSNEKRIRIETKAKTPQILQLAVSGVTELLRVLSFFSSDRLGSVRYEDRDETSVSSVDDVIMILKTDYENAYFVTGNFTLSIYTEDCLFEDPTIRFRGTELYLRNLKLLVPFFDSPSIGLQNIEKGADSETTLLATWKLRTYLKFPWKPLISIDGSTTYELNNEFKVVRHAESWNVSALEAVGQIFSPSFGRPNGRS
ncbi:uncharacterized protein [Euphorbia lathyris]|uniref:uncharacterized protein n=1 Tax=Euphorbia lathyris TaxID=212925 RepID=UPI0033139849